jgi:serine/threonine protein phosphatase 1
VNGDGSGVIEIIRTDWRPAIRTLGPHEFVAAIGDVHGNADLLAALHEALAEEIAAIGPSAATVVHLGDLIDRGPENRRTVALARRGVPGARAVTLLGNHEERLLEELAGEGPPSERWAGFGARALFAECGVEPDAEWRPRFRTAFGPDLIDWLSERPTAHRIGPLLFVHAGIDPALPLAEQDRETLLWIRESWWSHPGPYPDGVAVIHGHVPVPAVDLAHPHRLALDTRAYAVGMLSALVVTGDRMRLVFTRRR